MELVNGRPATNEGRLDKEIRCYDLLDRLGVTYQRIDHEEANTMEACVEIDRVLDARKRLTPYSLPDKDDGLRRRILAYLTDDPADACLEGLAKQLGYSKSYTGSKVKALTGETFGALLQRSRCETAAALLRESDEPISAVIRRVGYQNESFFRTAFQAVYGKTPLQYRKEHMGGTNYDE